MTSAKKAKEPILQNIFGIDLRALASLRIALGLILITDYCYRIPDLVAHYTDSGVIPRSLLVSKALSEGYSSFYYLGDVWFTTALFGLGILLAVGLIFGYSTRWMVFFSWILLVSLHYRNRYILNSGDDLLRCLLFWCLFLPLGRYWSWDNRSAPMRLSGKAFSIGAVAILLQIFFLYFFSAIEKSGDAWRITGTAAFEALHRARFATPFALELLNFPELLKPLTFIVLIFEFVAPLLLFSPIFTAPIRIVLVICFFLLQLSFRLALELGLFPWISSAAILIFLPPAFWDFFERMLSKTGIKPRPSAPYTVYKSPLWLNSMATLCLIYIFIGLLSSPKVLDFKLSETAKMPGRFLGIEQRWKMFSPQPSKVGGWYVIPGTLADGSVVDIFRDGAEVNWDRPKVISKMYPNQRWRQYLAKLRLKERAKVIRLQYANLLCRTWNDGTRHPNKRLESLEVFFMREKTLKKGGWSRPKKVKITSQTCR